MGIAPYRCRGIAQAAPVCIRKQARGNVAGGLRELFRKAGEYRTGFFRLLYGKLGGVSAKSCSFCYPVKYKVACFFNPVVYFISES